MPALIALAYLSLFVLSLIDNSRGPFYPEILTDLAVSATLGSLFFATVSGFSFIGSSTSHFWLHGRSAARVLGWSGLALGLFFCAISLSPTLPVMLVACAGLGMCFGILNVVQNLTIYEASSGEKRRRLYNGLHAMYGLASLAAPLVVSVLRNHGWTWRQSFFLIAVPAILVGLWGFSFRAPALKDHDAEKPAPLNAADWRACVLLSLAMACYLWGELSISTRLPLWLRSERGFSADDADYLLAAFFLTLLGGRIVFTALSFHRFGNLMVLLLSAGVSAVLYYAGLFWNPWLLGVTGLAMAPFYPVLMDQIAVHFGRKSSRAMGFIIGTGSLSLVAMHVVIGVINDNVGLTQALVVCASLMTVLTLGLLVPIISRK